MNKIITLTFALLFITGTAFAQVVIDQRGGNNRMTLDRKHVSVGSVTGANMAKITQNGRDNTAHINQVGAGNRFTVRQVGSHNLVKDVIHQGGWSWHGAVWDIDAGPSINGIIEIVQKGHYNVVHDADQAGYGNEVYIKQKGRHNLVDIEIQYNYNGVASENNVITISQYGNGNKVGDGTPSTGVGAFQRGRGNTMTITQHGGATAGTQSVSNQHGYPSWEGGQGLVQLGRGNTLIIDQTGSGSVVQFVMQDGAHNYVKITQTNKNSRAPVLVDVTQWGRHNKAYITQNSARSDVSIFQNGNYNVVHIK